MFWCSENPARGKRTFCPRWGSNWFSKAVLYCLPRAAFSLQELLAAKPELKLSRLIKKLAAFQALIIDDLGYVQQSREEMEVLFTLWRNATNAAVSC